MTGPRGRVRLSIEWGLRIFDLSLGQMLWSRRSVFLALLTGGPVVLSDRASGILLAARRRRCR